MKKVLFFLSLVTLSLSSTAQDTSLVKIQNYRLHDGTFNWRGGGGTTSTGTFFDKTTWNSSSYTQGHLKNYAGQFMQNFRLLIPQGYDANYSPGYPIIVMMHGSVERGNCYNGQCYVGTALAPFNTSPSYDKTVAPPPGTSQSNLNNLLNNDHHLINGGQAHMTAWNLAGTKKPDDLSLNPRAFPGFVLFPQMFNGWFDGKEAEHTIRILRLLMKKYKIDENRVYIHGLSVGGQGVLTALTKADWMFAAAAPMSAVRSHGNFRDYITANPNKIVNVPMWFFQGGRDGNPEPVDTENTVNFLRNAGADTRYTLYPNLGHGVWNNAYAEPDFFSWLLSKNKSDIHVGFGAYYICEDNLVPTKLRLPQGYPAYQWEKDGVIIPGATSNLYETLEPGVYRARFSRVSATPTEGQWNRWSNPVTLTIGKPPKPVITHTGSKTLRDLNNLNSIKLATAPNYTTYKWYRDGNLLSNSQVNTTPASPTLTYSTGLGIITGAYTVVVSGYNDCESPPSDPLQIFFNNNAPLPNAPNGIAVPTGFNATLDNPVTQPTTVTLRWNDVSGLERGYEIWRRKSSDNATTGWTLVTITPEDAILYIDQNLAGSTTYHYKIRAVSNLGRSNYAPGNNVTTQNLVITTNSSTAVPGTPQNLTASLVDTDLSSQFSSVKLTWQAPSSGSPVSYQINYGGNVLVTNSTATTYTVTDVPLNEITNFTVAAINSSNNVSGASNQISVSTYITGLFWIYSTKQYADLSLITEEEWNDGEFTGRSTHLDLGIRTQDENLIIKYYGYFDITNDGQYYFALNSNDGAKLYIDGEPLQERNSLVDDGNCETTLGPAIELAQGRHTIEVRYFQYQGDFCLSLDWKGPDAGPDQEAFYPFPNAIIRSYAADVVIPNPPGPPIDLVATSGGMTQINLSWNFTGDVGTEFEIYRATSENGNYEIINTVGSMSFADQNLIPLTTYWYKLRAVNNNGSSVYSDVASATTTADDEAPTAPTTLTLYSQTLTSASIGWTASTDNTAVTGYEIWLKAGSNPFILKTTTELTSLQITGLEPFTSYGVYIIAYDANGNKSVPSTTLNFSTSQPDVYYSKSSGALNSLATWGKDTDGGGVAPADFTTNGVIYTIANRGTTTVGGAWTIQGSVSKIVVAEDVVELSAESTLTGRMEVLGSAKVIFNSNTTPTFVSLSPNSTVQYNTGATAVQPGTYGNLIFNGTGSRVFASGTTVVKGNLTVSNGISLQGATNNQSNVVLEGDLLISGSPSQSPTLSAIGLELIKPGTQTITLNGSFDLFRLRTGPSTNVTIGNTGSPATLNLGSSQGGGLVLSNGTTLTLGANTLRLAGGSINSGGETGVISVNGGSLDITSASALNSNVYFDPANKLLTSLGLYLSGTGIAQIQNPVNVSDEIRIQDGSLYSNGNITMLSTATKTANLREIERNGRIYGNVHVQRYFDAKPRLYRYLSSPVVGTRVVDWQNFFPITGDFDGTSTGPGLGTTASMYYYANDTYFAYPSRLYSQDNTAPIQRGVGYSAFIRNTDAFTLTNTGNPHQGTIAFPLTPPAVSTATNGWQLLGNPYASTIAWTNNPAEWISDGISSTIAVRENITSTTNQYLYWDAVTNTGQLPGGRIAPGQAFWVRVVNTTPSLSITESAKVTPQQAFYREGESNTFAKIKLTLKHNTTSDAAFIVLTNFGTDGYDPLFDAVKNPNGGMFNFSSLTNDNAEKVAINNASDAFCSKSVKLDVRNAVAGTYSISLEDVESLMGIGDLKLVDKFTGAITDLRNQAYSFAVTNDPGSYGSERFVVEFNRPALTTDLNVSSAQICGTAGQVAIANPQRGAIYTLLNNNNEEIATSQTSVGETLTFDIQEEKIKEGVNEIRVRASFKGCASSVAQSTVQIDYHPLPQVTADNKSVCAGDQTQINASSSSLGASYNWYNSDNVKLKGNSSGTLMVDAFTDEVTYSVSAVLPNGCEGPRTYVTVSSSSLETPELTLSADTLSANVSAEQYTWTRNGEEIETTARNYIVTSEPGTYGVTARVGGCSKSAREFIVTASEGDQEFRYNVFPNPTSSDQIYLQVIARSNENVNVRMVDLVGREVYGHSFNTDQLKESVQLSPASRLRAGVYVVILEQKTRTRKIKLIVKE